MHMNQYLPLLLWCLLSWPPRWLLCIFIIVIMTLLDIVYYDSYCWLQGGEWFLCDDCMEVNSDDLLFDDLYVCLIFLWLLPHPLKQRSRLSFLVISVEIESIILSTLNICISEHFAILAIDPFISWCRHLSEISFNFSPLILW
jgi:hypothetical protein